MAGKGHSRTDKDDGHSFQWMFEASFSDTLRCSFPFPGYTHECITGQEPYTCVGLEQKRKQNHRDFPSRSGKTGILWENKNERKVLE
jgi:hypothetical protein